MSNIGEDFLAKDILEQWNFEVTSLPTSHLKKQSDYLVTVDGLRFLIEEKTKFDDPKREVSRDEKLANGNIHLESIPLVLNNGHSKKITEAVSQLVSSSKLSHEFRIVWFNAQGRNPEAKYNQFIATLYGTTNISELNSPHYRRCYFFRNSEFYRHRAILDGAVVTYQDGDSIKMRFCLNSLSERYNYLRDTLFTRTFAQAVEDPLKAEENGTAFVLDGYIDRNDERELLSYLEQKYHTLPLMKIDLGYTSVSTIAPASILSMVNKQ